MNAPLPALASLPWTSAVDLKLLATGAIMWLLWVPFCNLLHVAGQIVASLMLGFRVRHIDISGGDVYTRIYTRALGGVEIVIRYNLFFRGNITGSVKRPCCYRLRRIGVLLGGTLAMTLSGLALAAAVQYLQYGGGKFLPTDIAQLQVITYASLFAGMVLAHAVINIIPLDILKVRYGDMDGPSLLYYALLTDEDVLGEVHCEKAYECSLRDKPRMMVYHYMRAWKFIADRRGESFVSLAANHIFEAGKTDRACDLLLRYAERPGVFAGERGQVLNEAAYFVLCDGPRPRRLKEAVAWMDRALEPDNMRRPFRGTKGALCVEAAWMQDASAHLSAALAGDETELTSAERALFQAYHARVLAWRGDLKWARVALEKATAGDGGTVSAVGAGGVPDTAGAAKIAGLGTRGEALVARVKQEALAEIARKEAEWAAEKAQGRRSTLPAPASGPGAGKDHGKKKKRRN